MFYRRWGLPAIFFARFLPGLRAVVPVFAGVTHQRFRTVLPPVLVASGMWYGGLVWVGARAGQGLPALAGWVVGTHRVLLVVSLLALALVLLWWLRTRRENREGREE
jgi:membrane protein DedA with SNARE-associated domain